MDLTDRLTLAFMRRLVARPDGRAHLYRELADAEGNGENGVFEHILSQVDDPTLRRLIEKHRADEVRHQQMFLECAARTGVPETPVPDEVKYVERLFKVAGLRDHVIRDGRGVMEAYLLLQAVEERSIVQFELLAQALAPVDPAGASVVRAIQRDEERHLRYCHAVARRYAPDAVTHAETLDRMRRLEARAFADNGAANSRYVFARGYFDGGPLVRLFFRAMNGLSTRSGRLPLTRFVDHSPTPQPAAQAA
jgi:hypothetical protein